MKKIKIKIRLLFLFKNRKQSFGDKWNCSYVGIKGSEFAMTKSVTLQHVIKINSN
jgi:hypothetical protein